MVKIISGLFFLLVFISCSHREEIEFYRGTEKNSSKIVALCEIYSLPVSVNKYSQDSYVLKGPKDKSVAYNKILLATSQFLVNDSQGIPESGIKNFFIPKKNSFLTTEKEDSLVVEAEKYPYVLRAERVSPPKSENEKTIQLYFVSNPMIERRVDLFIEDLNKSNPDQSFIKSSIDLGLDNSPEITNIQSSLTVFEPFSFQVLNSEKHLAGMQFLLLLLLFLLSGFILGLWWRRKT